MLSELIHWLSSKRTPELLLLLMPLLLIDAPRYCVASLMMCMLDTLRSLTGRSRSKATQDFVQPSVCVVLAGLNEADTVGATLNSVWGSYPDLQVIVVDDGSDDGMSDVAKQFARTHEGVLVLTKPERGGKSSALNFAIPFVEAEIVVCVDTDSHLQPGAIWEIVQPFANPSVGAVAGTVLARNGRVNIVTGLQSAEYLRSIFLGRMLSSELGILGIVSGAFGAFRREALLRAQGWDVGPGEDGDLVLRMRKSGWQIVHAPYAQCKTNVPERWKQLFKQRRRWEWAIVTFECRKHIDMANVFSAHFRFANLVVLAEAWFFSILLTIAFFGYLTWLCLVDPNLLIMVLLTNYAAYLILDLFQWLAILYFSPDRRRDLASAWCTPLMPAYYFFLRAATLVAIIEESLFRRSFDDNFVPERVRQVTFRW